MISYKNLSGRLGQLDAIKAVANANTRNRLFILVPCHRVVEANGSLTGYAGGLPVKKILLELEGCLPSIHQLALEL